MHRSRFLRVGLAVASLIAHGLGPAPAWARTVGIVVENRTNEVVFFDADTDTVLGTFDLDTVTPPNRGLSLGECVIAPDGRRALVPDSRARVWVFDLETLRLAPGPNPIGLNVWDIEITPDGRYAVACSPGFIERITVIEIASQTVVSELELDRTCLGVDVCSDGSVLATFGRSGIRRLVVDGDGQITDTGESFRERDFDPNDVHCAPGAGSAAVRSRGFLSDPPSQIWTLTVPGLAPVDVRDVSAVRLESGWIDARRGRLLTRDRDGVVQAWDYGFATGSLGETPTLLTQVAAQGFGAGTDSMALHSDGSKLYITQPFELSIFDPETGAQLDSILDPAFDLLPTGVCLAEIVPSDIDIRPLVSPNTVQLGSELPLVVALLGDEGLDPRDVDASTLAFGPDGAAPLFDLTNPFVRLLSQFDVNGDGRVDLLSSYDVAATGIEVGDEQACLTGDVDTRHFEACDGVVVVPACGLGYEVALVLVPIMWARQRRRDR